MYIMDTTTPYKKVDYNGVQYTTCRDYNHISRYRGLRQVVHDPEDKVDRFMSLETPNPFVANHIEIVWHEVKYIEENRLDLISRDYLGSAHYAWIIAYFNGIEDGFTCREGQKLKIPKNISALMADGELLQNVPPLQLNLSFE